MKTTDRLDQPEVPAKDAQTAGTDFFSSSPVLFPACRTSGAGKASVTREQIRLARKADLHGFLLEKHPGLFRSSGCSIYMRSRDSLYIREGFPSYTDFSSGSHGNPIDFLTGFLGYGFVDAVMALTGGASCRRPPASPQEEHAAPHPIPLPESAEKPYRRVYAYLLGRGIPPGMPRILEQRSLLYQERNHGNAVFVNPKRDFCEMRGTLTYSSRPFHGCLKTKPDRFWYLLSTDKNPETAFLCEGAINAISLFLLHLKAGMRKPAAYNRHRGCFKPEDH